MRHSSALWALPLIMRHLRTLVDHSRTALHADGCLLDWPLPFYLNRHVSMRMYRTKQQVGDLYPWPLKHTHNAIPCKNSPHLTQTIMHQAAMRPPTPPPCYHTPFRWLVPFFQAL